MSELREARRIEVLATAVAFDGVPHEDGSIRFPNIERLGHFASAMERKAVAALSAEPAQEMTDGETLWLWKNGDHFLAFRHLYPCLEPNGDPMTLGEPFARAVFKHSYNRGGR